MLFLNRNTLNLIYQDIGGLIDKALVIVSSSQSNSFSEAENEQKVNEPKSSAQQQTQLMKQQRK